MSASCVISASFNFFTLFFSSMLSMICCNIKKIRINKFERCLEYVRKSEKTAVFTTFMRQYSRMSHLPKQSCSLGSRIASVNVTIFAALCDNGSTLSHCFFSYLAQFHLTIWTVIFDHTLVGLNLFLRSIISAFICSKKPESKNRIEKLDIPANPSTVLYAFEKSHGHEADT